ncbi:unnamed protein product [Prorocentrum cordatum]|uniref:Uncharacterized protein n=1 Tax=Prorocentrum cordatum TaxID=2364126 RepID=A0ABN9TNK6_9DINO|nr:unnamed protein product [Polarella glacialis]
MVPPPLAARLAASRAGPVALRRAQARVPAAVPPSCRRAGARGVMMFMDCQAHSSPMALLLSGRAELHTTAVLQSGTENANMNSIADPFDMPFEDSDEGGESDGEEPCEGAQAEPPAASAEADEKRAGGLQPWGRAATGIQHTLPLPPERQGEGAPAPRSGPRTLSLRVVLPSLPSSRRLIMKARGCGWRMRIIQDSCRQWTDDVRGGREVRQCHLRPHIVLRATSR